MSVIREPIHLGSFALPLEFYLTLVGAICDDMRSNSHGSEGRSNGTGVLLLMVNLNAEHGTKLNEDFYRAVNDCYSGGMADNHITVIIA